MRRPAARFQAPPSETRTGGLQLTDAIVMQLPERWTLLSSGSDPLPSIPGLTSFLEFADDEVVVTVVTREYSQGPDRLLAEITGHSEGSGDHTGAPTDLHLRQHARGRACCGIDGAEEFFVAALVMERPPDAAPADIGVEVVAAGPLGTVTERLPLLCSLVSTIDYG